LFLLKKRPNFAATKETKQFINNLKIIIMANKNFNAKKVLMSTIAAVALSFVVTTNADAVRVKVRVKSPQPKCIVQEQQQQEESKGFFYFLKQIFGIRV
jgi:hypothetical protein